MSNNVQGVKMLERNVEVELMLGLGPEDAALQLTRGSQRLDLQPWLLDAVAVKIGCLGHHDEVPRPWDWENILTSLEPEEELLYVLDHGSGSGAGAFELWLAVRFPHRDELDEETLLLRKKRAQVLISQLRRQAFPGSEVEWMEPGEISRRLMDETGPSGRCMVVTGMPSPRNLNDDVRDIDRTSAARNYQSLNDVVEALYDLKCNYRIAFVVQRVSHDALQDRLEEASRLYDHIHPQVQTSVRSGQSWSTNTSESTSTSAATGSNTSSSSAEGGSESEQKGESRSGHRFLDKFKFWGKKSFSESSSTTTGKTWTTTTTAGETLTTTTGQTQTTGTGQGGSLDFTLERVDSKLRLADFTLERTISALHEAHGTGGFRWGAFAFAEGHNAEIVGRSLMGVLAGSRTKDHPLVRFEVRGEKGRLLASRIPTMELVAEAAPVLSLPRVCDALLVPEAELPGLRLRRNVFLGRNIGSEVGDVDAVVLGPDAFSAMSPEVTPANIQLPLGDLFKHVLVSGATGSGKTTRVVEILNRLEQPHLSVVVFETAKRTYRALLQRSGRPAPLVYSLGSSTYFGGASRFRPLRVNPFYFELGTSLKRHIAVLSDALAELMPTEAMIGPLMRRAVEACYTERGWDIEAGRPRPDTSPVWPTVIDFVVQARRLVAQLNYGQEVNANYRGALESRVGLFLDATFQDIFGYNGNNPIDALFPPDRDAIIEVEELPPSDVDVRAFVMTLLLSRLRAVQGARRVEPGVKLSERDTSPERGSLVADRRWLLVVEEAHNVLDRQLEQRRPADESNAGRTLLRAVVRLLQEGREMGIGMMIIDQLPTRLARDVIGNTGTKITLRLEDAAEMAEIGQAMGLGEEAWQKLGFLQEGEALVKASYMDRPAKSARFASLTRRPEDLAPRGGWSPSFAELAARWAPALTGRGVEPDAEWAEQLLSCAAGDRQLAAFAGLRTTLLHEPERDLPELDALRQLLAEVNPAEGSLLAVGQALWSRVVQSFYAEELARAAALICCAVVPSALWRVEPLSGDGILLVAELLAKAGFGEADLWAWALAQTQEGGPTTRGQGALAVLADEAASTDRTATIRVLLSGRSDLAALRAGEVAKLPPGMLMVVVQKAVGTALPFLSAEVPAQERTDVETFRAEIEERLTRQVAALGGAAYSQEVNNFLSRVSRLI